MFTEKMSDMLCRAHVLKNLMNSICLRLIILRNICITACVKKSFYTFILSVNFSDSFSGS